jgi:hypothetical protein
MTEANSSMFPKLGEFQTYFSDIEITHENRIDNILIIKLYWEIILNLLKSLEYPGTLILFLLKFDEQTQILQEKYKVFLQTNSESEEKNILIWKDYFSVVEELNSILEKFRVKIEEEGANIKFTQNPEVRIVIK